MAKKIRCRVCDEYSAPPKCKSCGAPMIRKLRNIDVSELSFVDAGAIESDFEPLSKSLRSEPTIDDVITACDKVIASSDSARRAVAGRLNRIELALFEHQLGRVMQERGWA